MKLVLDACVWGGADVELTAAGHEVVHVGTSDNHPSDEEILAQAHLERRVLVTLDKDFGELVIVRGFPHAGIVRLVGIAARRQGIVCGTIIEEYGAQLTAGGIVTVEPTRVRVRLPIAEENA